MAAGFIQSIYKTGQQIFFERMHFCCSPGMNLFPVNCVHKGNTLPQFVWPLLIFDNKLYTFLKLCQEYSVGFNTV